MALVFLIAFVMGGAVVSSVRQVQATPEAIPQVIIGEVTQGGDFTLDIYYPDKQRIYNWRWERGRQQAPTCSSMTVNAPGQPPTVDQKCD